MVSLITWSVSMDPKDKVILTCIFILLKMCNKGLLCWHSFHRLLLHFSSVRQFCVGFRTIMAEYSNYFNLWMHEILEQAIAYMKRRIQLTFIKSHVER